MRTLALVVMGLALSLASSGLAAGTANVCPHCDTLVPMLDEVIELSAMTPIYDTANMSAYHPFVRNAWSKAVTDEPAWYEVLWVDR